MNDIKLIEEGAGNLSRALGITDERAEELKELCCEAVDKYENTAEVIDLMQVYAKHPNEQAFINYRIGICTACPAKLLKKVMGFEDLDIPKSSKPPKPTKEDNESKLKQIWRDIKKKKDEDADNDKQ